MKNIDNDAHNLDALSMSPELELGYTPEQNDPTPIKLLSNIYDMPFAEYRKIDALNFHNLRDFKWDPKAWKGGYFETKEQNSQAMTLGTQFHELVLQGDDAFNAHNALWEPPLNLSTGKPFGPTSDKYKKALSDYGLANAGKLLYSQDDIIALNAMRESIQWHHVAGPMLYSDSRKLSEMVVYGEIVPGFSLKGSIDRYDERFGLIDLKSTDSLDDETGRKTFYWKMRDYGYIEQIAFYQILIRDICGGNIPQAHIIAVESKLPFRCAVYTIDAEVSEMARANCTEWLKQFMKARQSGEYTSRFDRVQPVVKYWNAEN